MINVAINCLKRLLINFAINFVLNYMINYQLFSPGKESIPSHKKDINVFLIHVAP